MAKKTVESTPRTMEAALRAGFEVIGGDTRRVSKDETRHSGVINMQHPDGRALDVTFDCAYIYGKVKLDERVTSGNRYRLAHPELYDPKTGDPLDGQPARAA
jgi:hypothetical protein